MWLCYAITDAFFYLLPEGTGFLAGKWPVLILFLALVAAVVIAVVKGQTVALFKSKRLLRLRELELSALRQRHGKLENKNRNITDSLVYARKIQEALIPSPSWFRRHYSDSFLFFMPRDIISGDFYYVCRRGTRTFTVAADCTGHGVPGALMSMLGLQTIDRIINSYDSVTPAEILSQLSRDIESVFSRESDDRYAVKDGMEIAVCMTDSSNRILQFAGSFLPIYIISDGRLTEIKGDKHLVGHRVAGEVYTNHEIPLGDNDIIYLSTDGYSDQFGGTENKKFMLRRLRYLLVSISRYSMDDQLTILRDNILNWMGESEQIDDIMVLGFRPCPVLTETSL